MTEHEAEIARLHAFVLQMADRIAAASEVLSRVAERKDSAMAKLSQRNLDRMARGELPEPSEAEIQDQIANGLFVAGYAVYITSRRVKRCQCGRWPKSGAGDGASRGLADLIVRKRSWLAGVCLSLEVKRGGPVRYSSDEQKAAALAGDIVVVQSLEEALAAANAFDARVRV